MKIKTTMTACIAALITLITGCDSGPKVIEETVLNVKIHRPAMIEVKGMTKEITILSIEGNEGQCEFKEKKQTGEDYFPKTVQWNQTAWFMYKYCDLNSLIIETDQGLVVLGT